MQPAMSAFRVLSCRLHKQLWQLKRYDMKTLSRPYVQVVTREEWGAREPRKPPEALKTPVGMLMLFDTQTEECKTTEECKKMIKNLQEDYMYRGYDDIPWNFLIGSDGKVYEGRGWKVKPFKMNPDHPTQKEWDGRSMDIAYVGDYSLNDYDENPYGKYPQTKALLAVEKLTDHLAKKRITHFQTTQVTDFTIDLEAMQID